MKKKKIKLVVFIWQPWFKTILMQQPTFTRSGLGPPVLFASISRVAAQRADTATTATLIAADHR